MKEIRKVLYLLLLGYISLVAAQSTQSLTAALQFLCKLFYDILPMGVLVLVTLAGLTFAVGQTMGAETRARANVWATNMLIGAFIAGAVIIIVPPAVEILLGKSLTISQTGCRVV